MLLRWTRLYSSVNEMSPNDRPTQLVIDDDAKFDRWFERYQREIAVKLGRASASAGKPGSEYVPVIDPSKE